MILAKRRNRPTGAARLTQLLRAFAVWSICVTGTAPALAQETSDRSVLAFEFAVSIPDVTVRHGWEAVSDYIVSHGWSADGLHVAFLFWSARIYTLDIGSRMLIGPLTEDRPSGHVALSSDAKLLLVTVGREARLYSTEPAKLLARIEAPLPSCGFAEEPNSVFIAGAASAWISCSRGPGSDFALRYHVPSLELVEKVEPPAASASTWGSKGSLDLINHLPVLTGIRIWFEQPETGRRVARYAFDCARLDTKTPCFPSLPFEPPLNPRGWWTLSGDLGLAAIMVSPGLEKIDIYETASSKLLRSLSLSPAPSRNLRALAFTSSARMLVGAFDESKVGSGSIVVWDAQDGKVLQVEHPISVVQMSLSPDRRKLMAITHGEIRMYAVLE
jgi:hypothetical protein